MNKEHNVIKKEHREQEEFLEKKKYEKKIYKTQPKIWEMKLRTFLKNAWQNKSLERGGKR